MPYIVTTKRRYTDVEDGVERDRSEPLSRRAVATLEEARHAAYAPFRERFYPNEPYREASRAIEALGESGGTVGPLPDGTVIEVEQIRDYELAKAAGVALPSHLGTILDAFNAQETA